VYCNYGDVRNEEVLQRVKEERNIPQKNKKKED
jgi:hypothetical protein